MGGNNAILTALRKVIPETTQNSRGETVDCLWYLKLAKGATLIPSNVSPRQRIWIQDLPGTMHGKGTATTFGDWIVGAQNKVRFYLDDPKVAAVFVLLDCGTPVNKSMTRKATPNTPLTPPEGWRTFLARNTMVYDDNQIEAVKEEGISDLDILLPGYDSEKTGYSYQDYLTNKDFKKLFYTFILKYFLSNFNINPGKTVILRGRDTAFMLKDGQIIAPYEEMCIRYQEADSVMGYFAALYRDFDIFVDSIDFDVITSLLMGSASRLNAGASSTEGSILFANNVFVARGQWAAFDNSLIDINKLYIGWHKTMAVLKDVGCQPANPILDLATLMILSGKNDYVNEHIMPAVGPETLLKTYFTHCRAFPHGITQPHVIRCNYVGCRVNPEPMARFLLCCYILAKPSMTIGMNISKLEESLKTLAAGFEKLAKDKASKDRALGKPEEEEGEKLMLTMCTLRQILCHLSWTMSYFSAHAYNAPPPDPLEKAEGLSAWGWEMENVNPDQFGFVKAKWAENVNIEWMVHTLNAPVTTMKPPVSSISNVISDKMFH